MTNKNSKRTRAQSGGEYGVNGSFYQGGQFLPSSEKTVKGAQKSDKRKRSGGRLRKREIAPYLWAVQPYEGAVPLWQGLQTLTQFKRGTTSYSKETGKIGVLEALTFEQFVEISDAMQWYSDVEDRDEWLAMVAEHRAEVEQLAARWNAGERWYNEGEL